jgi:hypothetical protein
MMFDLYRRTFGDCHVVLSLAYSVYTAASIFLLEIQALKFAGPVTINKLKFCIDSLERVKAVNPGESCISHPHGRSAFLRVLSSSLTWSAYYSHKHRNQPDI